MNNNIEDNIEKEALYIKRDLSFSALMYEDSKESIKNLIGNEIEELKNYGISKFRFKRLHISLMWEVE